jgi:hypothetical protein
MENALLTQIQQKVREWRDGGYVGVEKETLNILSHIKKVGFLHSPQVEAIETYIYIKEILGNKPTLDVVKAVFDDERELIKSLGLSDKEVADLAWDKDKDKKIAQLVHDKYNGIDYANQVYALTMGSGKTILMGAMMLYDFVLSYYHQDDNRFGKNALVFAPDTTIIESLKEIKTFDYSKVLPREYENVALNIKFHYLENTESPVNPIGNYNIVVSNSQKIILKTRHIDDRQTQLFRDESLLKSRAIENKRLQAIREMKDLIVFVDEAHHSFGTTLEGTLKKTKETINYIHKEGKTPLVGVVNLTGTPYVKNKMINDVVYHFGLKQGIERGILKQVNFFEYGNVKTEGFVEDVIDKFWKQYGENRLEDRLPKIAFYASSIDDLQQELRPKLEAILSRIGIPLEKILEYHTEKEENKDDFLLVDTPQSKKQFILLVGKGTEGWNCRSLVSCALFRRPRSPIFVLQSSTRCLRSIGNNSTIASIFLSDENYSILDRELKNNFATTIEELKAEKPKSIEHTLTVEKKKIIKVKKVSKELISVANQEPSKIKIDLESAKSDKYLSYISESGITLNPDQVAEFQKSHVKKGLSFKGDFTFYEIVSLINRHTLLSCLEIEDLLLTNFKTKDEAVSTINENPGLLPYVIQSVLSNAYRYEEKVTVHEEELELTRQYPFKISIQENKNDLVVYKSDLKAGRLGFHINPYNFDSTDEKNLFIAVKELLEPDEAIVDIYFTGGVVDAVHNDFHFEYFNPEKKRIAKYFPDLIVETNKDRYLVVEIKMGSEKTEYEKNKGQYTGKREELFNEVFAKEVGFKEFMEHNKNFEYHIIFDAGLQNRQKELFERISAIE